MGEPSTVSVFSVFSFADAGSKARQLHLVVVAATSGPCITIHHEESAATPSWDTDYTPGGV